MSQMNQYNGSHDTESVAEGLDVAYQVRLYSPHPAMHVVIISDSDRVVPLKMVHIANQVVAAFKLNPAAVVWIEQVCSKADSAYAAFHLINFDWQAGQASRPQRSPIDENWYLSWVTSELNPSEPSYSS